MMNTFQHAFKKAGVPSGVKCPYCDGFAEPCGGDVIYPHRPDLYAKNFYICVPCDAYVGCHPGTTKPLGRLANAELRAAKSDAHVYFDLIWQSGELTRTEAYAWLAEQLSITTDQCHIGMFDVDMCKRVNDVCKKRMCDE